MNGFRLVRTPVPGMTDSGRANRQPSPDEDSLPPSEFEAARARPVDVRPALQDARDAIRRPKRG